MDNQSVCNNDERRLFSVETDEAIYKFHFSETHFEITGVCNMNCVHCRASESIKEDLPLAEIEKMLTFVRTYSPDHKEVTISGGEPLMHKEFREVMRTIRNKNVAFVTLTTNGSMVNKEIIEFINDLDFDRVTFSISIDSLDPDVHNSFRNHPEAYNYAINALEMLKKYGNDSIKSSLRATIVPETIIEMRKMTNFAINLGLDRISFSSIFPSGAALKRPDLWMDSQTLKRFSDTIQELYVEFCDVIDISSNEPLKWQSRGVKPLNEDGKVALTACPAGTLTFSVRSNGDMTPCPLMDVKIMNILNLSQEEIEDNYRESKLVQNLFDRSLKGICGECDYRKGCAGCRSRALAIHGDYLAEDPSCWGGPFKSN